MNRKKLVAVAVAVAALTLSAGTGIAFATGDDPAEQPTNGDSGRRATGSNIEKAKSIALDHTNGGRVTGTEIGDEEGYYEVEVARDDGTQVDVHLDRDLDVLSAPADHDGSEDGSNDK